MRYEKNRKIFGMDELQFMKLLRFLILPIIAVILILVIVISDLPARKKTGREAAEQETESLQESGQAAGEEAEQTAQEMRAPYDYANADPERCSDEEVNELVARYLTARASGDVDTVAEIFSITDDAELEKLKTQLDTERKLYDSFENTVNYVLPGVEEDSWIVYIRTDGWFKKIEIPAPMLFRTYVARGEDGSLHMKEDSTLSEAEREAVSAADGSEKVTAMNREQRTELAKAIVSDARLGSLYERLKVGGSEPETAPASTEAESVSEAVVQIGNSSAEADTEAAESSTDAAGTGADESSGGETETDSAETSPDSAASESAATGEGGAAETDAAGEGGAEP